MTEYSNKWRIVPSNETDQDDQSSWTDYFDSSVPVQILFSSGYRPEKTFYSTILKDINNKLTLTNSDSAQKLFLLPYSDKDIIKILEIAQEPDLSRVVAVVWGSGSSDTTLLLESLICLESEIDDLNLFSEISRMLELRPYNALSHHYHKKEVVTTLKKLKLAGYDLTSRKIIQYAYRHYLSVGNSFSQLLHIQSNIEELSRFCSDIQKNPHKKYKFK